VKVHVLDGERGQSHSVEVFVHVCVRRPGHPCSLDQIRSGLLEEAARHFDAGDLEFLGKQRTDAGRLERTDIAAVSVALRDHEVRL